MKTRLLSIPSLALRRISEFLVHRLGADGDLKVLALLVALLLFMEITPRVYKSATYEVPVSVVSENALCIVTGSDPASASVTLYGDANAFDELDPKTLAIRLRSKNEDFKSRETIAMDASSVTGAIGRLRVTSVSPAAAVVSLDLLGNWVTTNFVYKPRLVGAPLQSTAQVIMPENLAVTAFGSIKKLEEFSKKGIMLPTSPIDVEGKTQTFQTMVDIIIPADSGITALDPSSFQVTVKFTPVKSRGNPGGTASAPQKISLEDAAAAAAVTAASSAAPADPASDLSGGAAATGDSTTSGGGASAAPASELHPGVPAIDEPVVDLLTPEEKAAVSVAATNLASTATGDAATP